MDAVINEAKLAYKRAYAPYSKFNVGAAIKLKNGKIFSGCNIENVSYGLTNCAERVALQNVYANGYQKNDIEYLVIIADTNNVIYPCGACLQVMLELMPKDALIYLMNLSGDKKIIKLRELIPYGFEVIG